MDKAAVRSRLEAMEPVHDVFPTPRSAPAGERGAELADLATAVMADDVETVASLSWSDARTVISDDVALGGSALPELLELRTADDRPGVQEQLAGFARAGFNFFTAESSYAAQSLDARRARGGNGTVSRVMTSGESILLETRRLTLRFADDRDADDAQRFFAAHGLIAVRPLPFAGSAWQVVSDRAPAHDASLELLADDAVAYAEPDFIEYVGLRSGGRPDDPLLASQWHHRTLRVSEVWPQCTGRDVRVAVIDNGFMAGHPDLELDTGGSAWFRATTDRDDATLVPGVAAMPDEDHGTACAGMATARANSDAGVGVAYEATLHAIACLGDQVGTQLTLARALGYAADPTTEDQQSTGADVIACSLGPNTARWEMRAILSDAIDFVTTTAKQGRGVPLFWAVTNGNFPISADEVSSHPQVISVGRSTEADTDDGSGFGPELDFLAPGVDVRIPSSDGGYQVTTGTSFACPCAAGVAALVLQGAPDLTTDEVRDRMRSTSSKIGDLPYAEGRNDTFGFGRLDAAAAVAGGA